MGEGVEVPARRSPEQRDKVRLGVSGDLAHGRDAFVAADVAFALTACLRRNMTRGKQMLESYP